MSAVPITVAPTAVGIGAALLIGLNYPTQMPATLAAYVDASSYSSLISNANKAVSMQRTQAMMPIVMIGVFVIIASVMSLFTSSLFVFQWWWIIMIIGVMIFVMFSQTRRQMARLQYRLNHVANSASTATVTWSVSMVAVSGAACGNAIPHLVCTPATPGAAIPGGAAPAILVAGAPVAAPVGYNPGTGAPTPAYNPSAGPGYPTGGAPAYNPGGAAPVGYPAYNQSAAQYNPGGPTTGGYQQQQQQQQQLPPSSAATPSYSVGYTPAVPYATATAAAAPASVTYTPSAPTATPPANNANNGPVNGKYGGGNMTVDL